jgi:signal transduction histidine kinase
VLFFLVLGVLVPTACVLWFMNEAAKSQAEAAREQVNAAYRGQLRRLRDRVDGYWRARAASLKMESRNAAADFARGVRSGLGDSLIYLTAEGSVAYPQAAIWARDPTGERRDWRDAQAREDLKDYAAAAGAYSAIARLDRNDAIAARAAQGQVRSLVLTGNKEAALAAIQEYFGKGRLSSALDFQGRLIAADEQLLALRLMGARDRRYAAAVKRLTTMLDNYERVAMPSAQRLFLMDELRVLAPNGTIAQDFRTYAAERMAAEFLEKNDTRFVDGGLQRTRSADVWKLAAKDGRGIALFRTETVVAATRAVLQEDNNSTGGVRFALLPPGAQADGEPVASAELPGWQISFSLMDARAMEELARQRTTSYLWVAYLVIAAMAVTGLILGRSFRRQMRLAHLKTDLVAAVSHELKTPLSSMRLLVDSLLEDEKLDPAKTRDYLQLISGENQRLTRLIENFLAFSRIERNRQRFEFAATTPGQVVRAACEAVRERFQAPGCRFEVDISEDLPPVYADEDALVSVVLNLLDNAYKYTPGEKHISLRAYREGEHVVFAVADNGIGIAPREQKRIFKKFYQVDQRLARETGGVGLGLNIVEFIVRAHGGAVNVKSKPGEGSTFRVVLPAQESAA